jgi:simple sugar transport system permease protein
VDTVARGTVARTVHALLPPGVAILLALALSALLFVPAEGGVLSAYATVFSFAFGNPHGVLPTVYRAIYLLLCTFAFLIPLRAGLWNIGLPGQVYAGALAAFAVPFAVGVHDAAAAPGPPGLLIVAMWIAAAGAGAALGGFVGLLRARLQVNEILVTMMLNAILFWLVSDFIKEGGLFMSPTAEGTSFSLPDALRAPLLVGVPVTVLIALAGAVVLDWLFANTAAGYRARAFGHNPAAAHYGGIHPIRVSVWAFAVGGAFGGLAGYHIFGAVPGMYKIPTNYGYFGDLAFYGIICALIARGSSLGAVPVAVLFAGLSVGGRFAQGALGLPFGVDYAMLGVFMVTFVASHFLDRFRLRGQMRREPAQADARPERA